MGGSNSLPGAENGEHIVVPRVLSCRKLFARCSPEFHLRVGRHKPATGGLAHEGDTVFYPAIFRLRRGCCSLRWRPETRRGRTTCCRLRFVLSQPDRFSVSSSLERTPEIPRGDGTIRSPALTMLQQLRRPGQIVPLVGNGESFPHPIIGDRQNVQPAELEDQQHFDRTRSHAAGGCEAFVD